MNKIESEISNNIKIISFEGDYIEAFVLFSKDFTGFQGHFPNNPILPGICIVKASTVILSKVLKKTNELKEMKSVKFYTPVLPDSRLKYDIKLGKADNDSLYILKSKVTCDGKRTAQLKLLIDLK